MPTLRSLRERKKLTQVQLSQRTACKSHPHPVDQRTISRLELGMVGDPGYCTVIRLCRALGVDDPQTVEEFRC